MNYLIGELQPPAGACRVGTIKGVPDAEELAYGKSRAKGFPADANYVMNAKFPKDVKLTDVLATMDQSLVVSEAVKSFLESVPGALNGNEVLPVAIVNHKGRKEKARYFLIHQVNYPRAIDEKKTVGTKGKMNPDEYLVVKSLVIDTAKIPDDIQLFRMAQYTLVPVFRRDLAEKFGKKGFSGMVFTEFDDYDF